jgi:hypothetical protein
LFTFINSSCIIVCHAHPPPPSLPQDKDSKNKLISELRVLTEVSSPNLVSLRSTCYSQGSVRLALPLMARGDLHGQIGKVKKTMGLRLLHAYELWRGWGVAQGNDAQDKRIVTPSDSNKQTHSVSLPPHTSALPLPLEASASNSSSSSTGGRVCACACACSEDDFLAAEQVMQRWALEQQQQQQASSSSDDDEDAALRGDGNKPTPTPSPLPSPEGGRAGPRFPHCPAAALLWAMGWAAPALGGEAEAGWVMEVDYKAILQSVLPADSTPASPNPSLAALAPAVAAAPRACLPEAALRVVALAVARGVAALHQAGVLHCDVKPHNVMLSPEPTGEGIKLGDFGLAR